ncbi:Endoplasmic reticulum-golgi intermediate compartment protein, partial [Globisporangium splendens]
MGSWRRFDINAKGVEGIQERTIGGGVVTLLSCLCVAFLLFSEFSVWWTVDVAHRMHVDTDPDILIKEDIKEVPYGDEGCRLFGTVTFKKVAGDIMFAHEGSINIFSFYEFLNFNSSHTVNHLRFGPQIPNMETPLIDVTKIITNNVLSAWLTVCLSSVAVYKYFVNIVPTKYIYLNGDAITTFQYSVTEHETKSKENGQISFPGVIFSYEFSPIAVEYIESKSSFLHFLTSTSAIVGGVFAVARMIDSAIYSVSKKID